VVTAAVPAVDVSGALDADGGDEATGCCERSPTVTATSTIVPLRSTEITTAAPGSCRRITSPKLPISVTGTPSTDRMMSPACRPARCAGELSTTFVTLMPSTRSSPLMPIQPFPVERTMSATMPRSSTFVRPSTDPPHRPTTDPDSSVIGEPWGSSVGAVGSTTRPSAVSTSVAVTAVPSRATALTDVPADGRIPTTGAAGRVSLTPPPSGSAGARANRASPEPSSTAMTSAVRVEPSGVATSVVVPATRPSAAVTTHRPSSQVPSFHVMAELPDAVTRVEGGPATGVVPGAVVAEPSGAPVEVEAGAVVASDAPVIDEVTLGSSPGTLVAPIDATEVPPGASRRTSPTARTTVTTPVAIARPRPSGPVGGRSYLVLAASSEGCRHWRS